MIRKTGPYVVPQSRGGAVLPVSTASNRFGFISITFVYDEALTGEQDYYFQIRGVRGAAAAPAINIDYWSVSFSEV